MRHFDFAIERYFTAVFIFAVFRVTSCCDVVSLTFPSGFRIGTASSSYQVEGAWNASAYARVLFRELGDNVKRWSTVNEPDSVCDVGYEITEGPGIGLTGMGRYLCGHNILKAHAKTYRMYDEEFRAAQQGQIGIVIPITAYLPVNSSDTESEETAFQFNAGWMAHPIYKGDYPEILKTRVALVSEYQGYPRSRLPEFSDEWIAIIKRRLDGQGQLKQQSTDRCIEMEQHLIALFVCTVFRAISCCDVVSLTFPSGFRIGTASSAYQVEGAWNASDKGENVIDYWLHNSTESISDGSDGDIACNSYYKYQEDVAYIKSIGLDFYRFSISWSRVLPTGFANVISEDGLQYYKNLTAELVANGIEPIVTLYHWDHPQIIEEMGGWTNELIVDWFVAYARVVFEAIGGSVKRWITFNESDSFCSYGYESSILAPGKLIYGMGRYLCGHNVLKAHAKTYRMYDAEFRATQQGQVSLVIPMNAYLPANSSDTESTETAFQFTAGWMAHPIYKGDYPEIMKKRVALVSEYQGYPRSRLPVFSDEWIAIINGTADYFGVNHYTTNLVSPDPDEELGIYNSDNGLITSVDPSWPATIAAWFYVYPPGFGDLLRLIRDKYGNPPVWVMENGYPDAGGSNDYNRISYFYEYLREMLIAIKRDGCNVEGYAIWSILDNWEWSNGYTNKFGIVSVDFDDPDRTRSAKLSTSWWRSVMASRRLQSVPTDPTSQTKTVPWNR